MGVAPSNTHMKDDALLLQLLLLESVFATWLHNDHIAAARLPVSALHWLLSQTWCLLPVVCGCRLCSLF